MTHTLPDLPYKFDALEPHIDAATMEIHHGKHHAGYVAKLNAAVAGTEHEHASLEALLAHVGQLGDLDTAVRNNGGGHYNHSLFWESLTASAQAIPTALHDAINASFGSFEDFKTAFSNAAATRFGSGWAWLAVCDGTLKVCSTANQDNPLMPAAISGCSGTPILGLDVWEHAYYLHYQNRRPDYIEAFFNVVNWDVVAARYLEATA